MTSSLRRKKAKAEPFTPEFNDRLCDACFETVSRYQVPVWPTEIAGVLEKRGKLDVFNDKSLQLSISKRKLAAAAASAAQTYALEHGLLIETKQAPFLPARSLSRITRVEHVISDEDMADLVARLDTALFSLRRKPLDLRLGAWVPDSHLSPTDREWDILMTSSQAQLEAILLDRLQ